MSEMKNTFASIALGTVLLVAALAAGGVAAGAGTADAGDAAATPTASDDGTASIGAYTYDVTIGETVAIEVELANTSTAALQFGDATTDYTANVTVTDGDGDGTVTVLFDTAATGTEESAFAVESDADGLTVDDETTLAETVGVQNLPVTAFVDGEETDGATILLREEIERGTDTATGDAGDTDDEATPSATATAADDESEATDEATAASTDEPADEDSTEQSSPGFGLVAALLALAGAALVARR
jgi:PGF-CTERM protein